MSLCKHHTCEKDRKSKNVLFYFIFCLVARSLRVKTDPNSNAQQVTEQTTLTTQVSIKLFLPNFLLIFLFYSQHLNNHHHLIVK